MAMLEPPKETPFHAVLPDLSERIFGWVAMGFLVAAGVGLFTGALPVFFACAAVGFTLEAFQFVPGMDKASKGLAFLGAAGFALTLSIPVIGPALGITLAALGAGAAYVTQKEATKAEDYAETLEIGAERLSREKWLDYYNAKDQQKGKAEEVHLRDTGSDAKAGTQWQQNVTESRATAAQAMPQNTGRNS